MTLSNRSYWKSQDLVMIGVFAAAIKLTSLLIALAGGGMNPISLILKNLVFTSLLIVLLLKVRKLGALLLFTGVSLLVSIFLMGSSVTLLPSSLLAAVVAEAVCWLTGGITKSWGPFVTVAVYDACSKLFSVAVSFLMMREMPMMVWSLLPIIAIGYLGSLVGLWVGARLQVELRHAGLLRS